jgi:recombination endonuclease VII
VSRGCAFCYVELGPERSLGTPTSYCSETCRRRTKQQNRARRIAEGKRSQLHLYLPVLRDPSLRISLEDIEWLDEYERKRLGRSDVRVCRRCRLTKLLESFRIDPKGRGGFASWCKDCVHQQQVETGYKRPRPEPRECAWCGAIFQPNVNGRIYCSQWCSSRSAHCRRLYKMTGEQFRSLLAAQRFRCAICRTKCDAWHVDHDHETGLVRGLLCRDCNVALGHFRDSPEALRRAAGYLESSQKARQLRLVE